MWLMQLGDISVRSNDLEAATVCYSEAWRAAASCLGVFAARALARVWCLRGDLNSIAFANHPVIKRATRYDVLVNLHRHAHRLYASMLQQLCHSRSILEDFFLTVQNDTHCATDSGATRISPNSSRGDYIRR